MTNPHLVHARPNSLRTRHRLIAPLSDLHICGSIKSVESLRRHLQTAIELEHSTIPPYLCALYSIDATTNAFAYQTIQSVVMEEMLHMILACNILNALGGRPSIDHPHFIPEYPTYLPHSNQAFKVPLEKFSKHTLHTFLKIEQPAPAAAPPEANHYQTIGQFYKALKHAINYLDAVTPGGIFTGDPSRQVLPEHYYGGGGKLIAVYDLDDANQAIDEIVGQGEGIDGTIFDTDSVMFGEEVEYAHYFKYNEILHERRYAPTDSAKLPPTGPAVAVNWQAVSDMQTNPKMADFPVGSPTWQAMHEFNRTYMTLLRALHDACNGAPASIATAIPQMYALKYQALALMQIPNGKGHMTGPSFEYIRL